MQRVVTFLNVLVQRLRYLEEDFVKERLKTEEFADLLAEAVVQSAEALSPERKDYIANLLTRSLTGNELDHAAQKRLLTLLNSINDAELLLLKFYSLPLGVEREAMIERYPFIKANLKGQSEAELKNEEEILFQGYWGHLVMTSLVFGNSGEKEKPTKLALVLLKYVGLIDSLPVENPPNSS